MNIIVPKALASDSVGLNNVQNERRAKNHESEPFQFV
jgi:hypothetical protein